MAVEKIQIQVTETGAKQVARSIEQIGTSSTKSNLAIDALKSALGGLVAGIGIAGLTQIYDAGVRVENSLRLGTASAQEFEKAFSALAGTAQTTGQPLEAMAVLYQRLSSSSKDLKLNQDQVLNIVDNVARVLQSTGASASQASGALMQLSQAFGTGKVQAEEMNSILEGFKPLADQVAASLGVTSGSLKRMVLDGKLSSKQLADAILEATLRIQNDSNGMAQTFGGAIVRIQNAFQLFIIDMNKGTGVFSYMVTALNIVASNFRVFGGVVIAISAIIIGQYVGQAIAKAISATLSMAQALVKVTGLLVTNPWVLIAAAVAAFAVVLYRLGQYWKPLGDAIQWVINKLKEFGNWLGITSGKVNEFTSSLSDFTGQLYDAGKATDDMNKHIADLAAGAGAAQDAISKTSSMSNMLAASNSAAASTTADVASTSQMAAPAISGMGSAMNSAAASANNYASALQRVGNYGKAAGTMGGDSQFAGAWEGTRGTFQTDWSPEQKQQMADADRQARLASMQITGQEAVYKYLTGPNGKKFTDQQRSTLFNYAMKMIEEKSYGGPSLTQKKLELMGYGDFARYVEKNADTKYRDSFVEWDQGTFGGGNRFPTYHYSGGNMDTSAPFGMSSGLPGFADGGSFMVGGSGAEDSKLVAFRATPGEFVRISNKGTQGDGQTINVQATVVVPDVRDTQEFAQNRAYLEDVMANTMRRATARN